MGFSPVLNVPKRFIVWLLILNVFNESVPYIGIAFDPTTDRPVPHRHGRPLGLEMATSSQ